MAFLDNSGDIILDAVLTDLGRRRMAEGKFNIIKFALGDEEINYQLWDTTQDQNAHYDLQILQTPLLEAFTSNESLMRSKLFSLARTDLLYMPILKVNDKFESVKPSTTTNGFILLADRNTVKTNEGNKAEDGFMPGRYKPEDDGRFTTKCINIDQGIDSTEDGRTVLHSMDPGLLETSFTIKVDSRLLQLSVPQGMRNYNAFTRPLSLQYLDDDYIASYFIAPGTPGMPIVEPATSGFRSRNLINDQATESTTEIEEFEMFQRPLGKVLQFVPRVTSELEFSESFFDKLGSTGTNLTYRQGTIASYKYIDTTINVQGMTTGATIDIPIRIVKKT